VSDSRTEAEADAMIPADSDGYFQLSIRRKEQQFNFREMVEYLDMVPQDVPYQQAENMLSMNLRRFSLKFAQAMWKKDKMRKHLLFALSGTFNDLCDHVDCNCQIRISGVRVDSLDLRYVVHLSSRDSFQGLEDSLQRHFKYENGKLVRQTPLDQEGVQSFARSHDTMVFAGQTQMTCDLSDLQNESMARQSALITRTHVYDIRIQCARRIDLMFQGNRLSTMTFVSNLSARFLPSGEVLTRLTA
jgi:hypothetical protein